MKTLKPSLGFIKKCVFNYKLNQTNKKLSFFNVVILDLDLNQYLQMQKRALFLCLKLGVRQDFTSMRYPQCIKWNDLKVSYIKEYNRRFNLRHRKHDNF